MKSKNNKNIKKAYVLAVDIGTTTIKVAIFDDKNKIITCESEKIKVEILRKNDIFQAVIDPDKLWNQFVELVKKTVSNFGSGDLIDSFGICCQRNTFITWDKRTMKPIHPLITWKDCRGKDECNNWNNGFFIKLLNFAGTILYFLFRNEKFKSLKIFRFINGMVSHRFLAISKEYKEVEKLRKEGLLGFGLLDTWLIAKLTNGKNIVTDPSGCSTTGLYDPFIKNWSTYLLKIISFPSEILPKLTSSAGEIIGITNKSIFGYEIPICSLMGDQQAAIIGSGCISKGDVKISLGTGSFINVNTNKKVFASLLGLYPVCVYKIKDDYCFAVEGVSSDTADVIKWAGLMNLYDNIENSSNIAFSGNIDNYLNFYPFFSGVQTPTNDTNACCGLLGINSTSKKEDILRAILESISFRIFQLWKAVFKELSNFKYNKIRICGGVAANDFICQTISTLLNTKIERPNDYTSTTLIGSAFMCGVTRGYYKITDISEIVTIDKTFFPNKNEYERLMEKFNNWEKALERTLNYYGK
ncbi:Putative glycerol kinase 5 [Strongyloides ratti]|uniref:Putative glycerol kinase 5 n=1 Tax=Strongyloides ratti TaxID=34506 RepID=A0A090KQJ3_STRRB|nr:Putative glycerol kinase 5 [Strongyloides ratti]CEF59649.1 Putative glycerol kinase 5 [Strongyloides ratti]